MKETKCCKNSPVKAIVLFIPLCLVSFMNYVRNVRNVITGWLNVLVPEQQESTYFEHECIKELYTQLKVFA